MRIHGNASTLVGFSANMGSPTPLCTSSVLHAQRTSFQFTFYSPLEILQILIMLLVQVAASPNYELLPVCLYCGFRACPLFGIADTCTSKSYLVSSGQLCICFQSFYQRGTLKRSQKIKALGQEMVLQDPTLAYHLSNDALSNSANSQ